MKILLIHNRYKISAGEDAVVAAEQQLLQDRGHEIIPYFRSNHEIDRLPLWQKAALLVRTTWSQQSYEAVRALIRQHRPEVAHVHNTLPLISPSVYFACDELGVPVVQTLHNFRLLCPAATLFRANRVCKACLNGSLRPALRYGCYRASRVQTAAVARMLAVQRRRATYFSKIRAFIVMSEFHRRLFQQQGFPEERLFVKPNFFDRAAVPRHGSGEYALYLGRLAPEKGVHVLLQAWTAMPGQPLLIAGEGPERGALEEFTRARGLSGVRFLGHCPHERVDSLLRGAQFLALPSIWYEGMPVVLLEAFASGVPVLASRIGALAALITHGESGLLFEAGAAPSLAAAAKRLLAEPALRLRLGAGALSAFRQYYTASPNYARLMQIYAHVCG